jgi:hypothetical protein
MIESILEEHKDSIDYAAVLLEGEFTSPQLFASDQLNRKNVESLPAFFGGKRTPGHLLEDEVPTTQPPPFLTEDLDLVDQFPEAEDIGCLTSLLKSAVEDIGYNPNLLEEQGDFNSLFPGDFPVVIEEVAVVPPPPPPPMPSVVPLHASYLLPQVEGANDSDRTVTKRGFRVFPRTSSATTRGVDQYSAVSISKKRRVDKGQSI